MFGEDPAYLRMIPLAHFHRLRYLLDGLVDAQLPVVFHVRPHSMGGGLLDGWAVRLGFLIATAIATGEVLDWLGSPVTRTEAGKRLLIIKLIGWFRKEGRHKRLRLEVVVTFKGYLLLLDLEPNNILLEFFLKLEARLRYLFGHLFLNAMIRFRLSFMARTLPALLLRSLLPTNI